MIVISSYIELLIFMFYFCSLSKQGELHQRLQMEPVISPTQITSSKPKAAPKDLTSTLINNNLEEMKLNPSSIPKPPQNVSLQMSQNIQGNFSAFHNSYQPMYMTNSISNFNNTSFNQNIPSNSSGLSPAAFFSNNVSNNINLSSSVNIAQTKSSAKPLTSSEINDFLN